MFISAQLHPAAARVLEVVDICMIRLLYRYLMQYWMHDSPQTGLVPLPAPRRGTQVVDIRMIDCIR